MTLLGFHIEDNIHSQHWKWVIVLRAKGLYDGKTFAPICSLFFFFFLLLQSGSQPLLLQGSIPTRITLYCVNIYDLIVTYGHIMSTLCHNLHLKAPSEWPISLIYVLARVTPKL